MSFSTEVKAEISQNELRECCRKAELAALIQLCSSISISSRGFFLNVRIENATTARRIFSLLKEQYHVQTELQVLKNEKLKKNNTYIIQVQEGVKDILTDLTLLGNDGLRDHPLATIVKKECCARAYLAGAFLSSGSVNSPVKTDYHLEIATIHKQHADYIQKLMQRFDLPAKVTTRRKQYVVYLKASEKISDFLRCIGAHQSVMAFEDMRIQRDFRNSLQRLDNCELANEVKTLEACQKQLEAIRILEENHRTAHLDIKLQEVISLRKEHQDASLVELCDIYEARNGVTITKSGMKHRLAKIIELANRLRVE